ncbi:hypothetical protein BGW37DRAFT_490160 [Umbelopsis sp. PMI_123]|nr:hypothetical protein BGW37DRAFT_490160 [Umbelopsis sp. PMI_123]
MHTFFKSYLLTNTLLFIFPCNCRITYLIPSVYRRIIVDPTGVTFSRFRSGIADLVITVYWPCHAMPGIANGFVYVDWNNEFNKNDQVK